jgi:hypothetical protein
MKTEPRKWSWVEFILGWINKQFLIWCVSTTLVFIALFVMRSLGPVCETCGHSSGISESIQKILVIGWIVISFCLFFYKALSILIENGKLNVDAGAKIGISKEIK